MKNNPPQMFNRRFDDIVVIINHEIKIIKKNNEEDSKIKIKNRIYVDYLNNFGEKFFGLKINSIDQIEFYNIINRKMAAIINNFFKDEEAEVIKKIEKINSKTDIIKELKNLSIDNNFLNFFRRLNNFSMRDSFGKDRQVSIKIFPLSTETSKNSLNNFYYLIIRSLELEIEFVKFRNKFFQNMGVKNKIDPYFDVFDLSSSINEIKMLLAFKKKNINVQIVIGCFNINQFYNDHILVSSAINVIVSKIRPDDFVGILDERKIFLCLFNCSYFNGQKVFERILNQLLLNNYISEKYKNQLSNIFSFNCLEITENDDEKSIIDLIVNK